MNQHDLQHMSVAELVELVVELRRANEQIRTDSVKMSRLPGEIQEILETGVGDDATLALLTMSQFLAVEYSYTELAEMLQERSAGLFGMDYSLLFLANEQGALAPAALPQALTEGDAPLVVEQAAVVARQTWDEQSVITTSSHENELAFVTLPLTRFGQRLGALVLARRGGHAPALTPSTWALLTVFTGMIVVACDTMQRLLRLKEQTRMLEGLVTQRTHQLQSSRDILRIVFDHVPDGLLLLDEKMQVLAANQALSERLLGIHPRQIVGRPYDALWRSLEQMAEAQLARADWEQGGVVYDRHGQSLRRVQCVDRQGTPRRYDVRRSMIADTNGKIEHYLEIWHEQVESEVEKR